MEEHILTHMRHPNIVRLLGSGKSPRRFIVLEYLKGGTLAAVMNKFKGKSSMSLLVRDTMCCWNIRA